MYSRKHLAPLALIGAVCFAICTAVALLIDWLPESIGPESDRIDWLMWFLYWSSAVIFSIVVAVIVYCVWKFRAAPGDDSDGPPTHGNTMLEIIWTVIPTLLLVFVGVVSVIVLNRNESKDPNRLILDANGQQFEWRFRYPEDGLQSGDLRVPAGRQIELRITASDVIHSFWVPEIRLKQDATPGIRTHLLFTAEKPGAYPIICAELCGVSHAIMRSRMIVMPPAEYDAWLESSKQAVLTAKAP